MFALIGQNNKTLGVQTIVLSGSYGYNGTARQPTLTSTPSNPPPSISGTKTNAGSYNYTNFTITPYGGFTPSYSGQLDIAPAFIPLNFYLSYCFNDGNGGGLGVVSLNGSLVSSSDSITVAIFNGYGTSYYTLSNASPSATFYSGSYYFTGQPNTAQTYSGVNYYTTNYQFYNYCWG